MYFVNNITISEAQHMQKSKQTVFCWTVQQILETNPNLLQNLNEKNIHVYATLLIVILITSSAGMPLSREHIWQLVKTRY